MRNRFYRSAVLVLFLVAATTLVVWKCRPPGDLSGASFPLSRVPELAPAEASEYVQVNNPKVVISLLTDIDNGAAVPPEDREALTLFRIQMLFLLAVVEGGLSINNDSLLQKVLAMDPQWFFYATVDNGHANPDIVAGISFHGRMAAVESARVEFKALLLKLWPDAVSELSTHRQIEIESIRALPARPEIYRIKASETEPPPPVHLAIRENWVLISTNLTLLQDTLDRLDRVPEAKRSLAQTEAFSSEFPSVPEQYHTKIWTKWMSAP